ncbi:TPR-like protein [Atractiella rhizophila]|nr:TPR-like protein [Atractiella rhizophila]
MDYDFPLDPALGGPTLISEEEEWDEDDMMEHASGMESEGENEEDEGDDVEEDVEYEEGELKWALLLLYYYRLQIHVDVHSRLIAGMGGPAGTQKDATTSQALGAWQQEIQREMEEDDESFDQALGIAKRSRKRTKKKARLEQNVSAEVRSMLGRANMLYVQQEYTEAISLLNEVIKHEPSLRNPWHTLSTIWQELGDVEKSLQAKIVAAKLTPLKEAGDVWKEAGNESRELGMLQQAVYCYTQALKIDKNDTDASWDRAILYKELGNPKAAISSHESLLKLLPHDPNVLRELIPLLYHLPALPAGIVYLQSAFNHYRSTYPDPSKLDPTACLSISDLSWLVDMLIKEKAYMAAIKELKTNMRWLQNRMQDEDLWRLLEEFDDREFDPSRADRAPVGSYGEPAELLELLKTAQELPTAHLPVVLRGKLGVCRMGLGDEKEAKRHFSIARESDPAIYQELHLEIGDTLFEHELWEEALEVFDDLVNRPEFQTVEVYSRVGLAQRNSGRYREAADTFEAAVESDPNNLELKLHLAGIYEELREWAKSLDLVNEVLEIRKQMQDEMIAQKRDDGSQAQRGIFPQMVNRKRKNPRRMTAEERRAFHAAVQEEFELLMHRLELLESQDDYEALKDWTELAGELITRLREDPRFFPHSLKIAFRWKPDRRYKRKKSLQDVDEQANVLADRIQMQLVREEAQEDEQEEDAEDYRGVHFDRWMQIIMKYAVMCTQFGDPTTALETLDHLAYASVFRKSDRYYTNIQLTRISVCFNTSNWGGLTESIRLLINRFPLHPDFPKLWQALCSQGHGPIQIFSDVAFGKVLERRSELIEVLASDVGANLPITKEGFAVGEKHILRAHKGRWVLKTLHPSSKLTLPKSGQPIDEDDDLRDDEQDGGEMVDAPWRPKNANPFLQAMLGNMSILSRSYQWSIRQYLKVYENYPSNALICLCLAVGYIFRAMTRKVDNRHYAIAQAMAFLQKYRRLKGESSETQYNLGRAFHSLGLHHLAIPHYEKVIEMSKNGTTNGIDYANEARYNLHLTFASVGQPELSRSFLLQNLSITDQ